MSVNEQQGQIPKASSIPKRPSKLSEQQLSNQNRPTTPQKGLTSISNSNIEKIEQSPTLSMPSTEKPEQSPTLSRGDSIQSNELNKRSSLSEMATMRLDAARLPELPRSNTILVWKKVRVSYTATVNVRRGEKKSSLVFLNWPRKSLLCLLFQLPLIAP